MACQHAAVWIENPSAYAFRFPLPHQAGQQQDIGFPIVLCSQAIRHGASCLRRVGEYQAGTWRRGLPQQIMCRLSQAAAPVARSLSWLQPLGRVKPLAHHRIRLVGVVEEEWFAIRLVASGGERDEPGLGSGFAERGTDAGGAFGQSRQQLLEMRRQMGFIQEHQTVGARHRRVDGPQFRPVAAEQQARSVHGQGAEDDYWRRRVCGRVRR